MKAKQICIKFKEQPVYTVNRIFMALEGYTLPSICTIQSDLTFSAKSPKTPKSGEDYLIYIKSEPTKQRQPYTPTQNQPLTPNPHPNSNSNH